MQSQNFKESQQTKFKLPFSPKPNLRPEPKLKLAAKVR